MPASAAIISSDTTAGDPNHCCRVASIYPLVCRNAHLWQGSGCIVSHLTPSAEFAKLRRNKSLTRERKDNFCSRKSLIFSDTWKAYWKSKSSRMDSLLDNHYVDKDHVNFENSTKGLNSGSLLEILLYTILLLYKRETFWKWNPHRSRHTYPPSTQSTDKVNPGNHYVSIESLLLKGKRMIRWQNWTQWSPRLYLDRWPPPDPGACTSATHQAQLMVLTCPRAAQLNDFQQLPSSYCSSSFLHSPPPPNYEQRLSVSTHWIKQSVWYLIFHTQSCICLQLETGGEVKVRRLISTVK